MDYLKIFQNIKRASEKDLRDFSVHADWFDLCRLMVGERAPDGHKLNHALREVTQRVLTERLPSVELANKYYDLHRKSLLLDAPVQFDAYCQYLEWNREPEKKFFMPRREVLLPLVRDLQDLADRIIDFLGISLPPRVGKSTLAILFLTWQMGRHPDYANVMSGHSDKLTDGFFREVFSILSTPDTYLWADVFPGIEIVETSAKNESIDLLSRKRFPTFTARSIGGTLTGAVEIGEKGLLYTDDLVEDLEEALNASRLDAKYDAYLNQLKDRKKDGALELMVGTRWGVRDPLGRIKEQYIDNPRYRFTVMPALNDKDESNFDYPFGVGFSTQYYHDMRASIDAATWAAKYMGKPYVREGLLYNSEELRRYFELPNKEPDAIIAVCDTKDRGTDYCVMPIIYKYGQNMYVEDVVCDNGIPEVVEPRLVAALLEHKVQLCRFESNSAGGRVADKVQEEIKRRGGIAHITKKYTTSNKETRIIVSSPYVRTRFLFKDDSVIGKNQEYKRMLEHLCTYTMAGKNPHDDVPDAFSMLSEFVQSFDSVKVTVFERPF